MHSEEAYTFKTAQFTLRLYLEPEDIAPDWDFETEQEKQELLDKIEDGSLLYFCAHVAVEWKGNEIGSAYLGCCCYETVDEFKRCGYFYDMAREAIKEARKTLNKAPRLRAA